MSRSNPCIPNPANKWFEWAGDKGHLKRYDKEKGESVDVNIPFTFLLLDELSKIGGFSEERKEGIYSNEVHNTTQEPFNVRCGKNMLAEGYYGDIKEMVKSNGGHFLSSLYIAYYEGKELVIGNLSLKGAALSAWMDFKEQNKAMMYEQAIKISGAKTDTYEDDDEEIEFTYPIFGLRDIKPETHESAKELDKDLQKYLESKLKYTGNDKQPEDPYSGAQKPGAVAEDQTGNFDDIDDDLPF